MKVNEVFESVQGEGINVGEPCVFVRMQGCNNHCTWCDSKYALKGTSTEYTDVELASAIMDEASKYTSLVVFTGGEPLLQQDELLPVMKILRKEGYTIHVETNGTIMPDKALYKIVELFNCSPKLPSSGNESAIDLDVMKYLSRKAVFKFVVCDTNELLLVKTIRESICGEYMLMAEGATRKEQIANSAKVIEWCIKEGFDFSPRLQVLTWDNKRGV